MPAEQVLIRKVKNGNKRAFKKLYDAHADHLYRFLMQFSQDRDLVEEWVQNAFIKAYIKIDQFKGDSKFSTWLFAIGINEMKTDFKRQKKDFVPIEEIINESILNVEFNFEWHHDMKWLLCDLSENKKAVFILHEVEGYKHSEIADILDISDVASRTILSRTKQQLKEKWLSERGENANTG